jgi:F0F1-type ATP synthase membrane subunit a
LGLIPLSALFTLLLGEKRGEAFGGTATGDISTTAGLAICAFCFIHANGIAQVFRSLRDGTYGHHESHEELAVAGGEDAIPGQEAAEHHAGHVHHGHGVNAGAALVAAVPLYFWNFAPHPFRPQPGGSWLGWVADVPMWGLLLVLEILGAFIKPFALTMRLFANMIAGHIVLAALVMLIPVGLGLIIQIGIGLPVMVLSVLISLLEIFVAFLQAYIFTFLTTLFIASAVAPEH